MVITNGLLTRGTARLGVALPVTVVHDSRAGRSLLHTLPVLTACPPVCGLVRCATLHARQEASEEETESAVNAVMPIQRLQDPSIAASLRSPWARSPGHVDTLPASVSSRGRLELAKAVVNLAVLYLTIKIKVMDAMDAMAAEEAKTQVQAVVGKKTPKEGDDDDVAPYSD